jgi:hypothetical protein
MAFKLRKKPKHYSENSNYISYDDFLDQNYKIGYYYSSHPVDEYGDFYSLYRDCLYALGFNERELPLNTFAEKAQFSREYDYSDSWTVLRFDDKFPFSKEEYSNSKVFKEKWENQEKQNQKIIASYNKRLDTYNKWYAENSDEIEKLLEKKAKQKVDKLKKQKALLEKQKAKIEKELKEFSNA